MYYWGFNLTVVRFRKGRALRKNIEKSEGRARYEKKKDNLDDATQQSRPGFKA